MADRRRWVRTQLDHEAWRLSGAPTAFATGAILALFAALLLLRVPAQGAAEVA